VGSPGTGGKLRKGKLKVVNWELGVTVTPLEN